METEDGTETGSCPFVVHGLTGEEFSTKSLKAINLAMRIDKSMINIQNLRPADFKMETLDDELQCMAMIRALPEEYAHLSTSLLLLEKLDKDVILQAFKAEEMNRKRRVEIVDEKAAKAQQKRGPRKNFNGKPGPWVKDATCFRCGEKEL